MTADDDVIRAIEMAVSADPGNFSLRVHLSGLLLGVDRPRDALEQLEVVLNGEPDHLEALGLASQAATVLGDPRASAWRRLHASLSESGSEAADPVVSAAPSEALAESPSGDPTVNASPGPSQDLDWDRFLEDILREAGYLEPVTLADVGGLTEVKQRLEQSFLAPLRNPELRRTYGANLRGGLLLWGPPGCGKTLLARAVAGELAARFVTVGLHQILDMWLGNSEKQLHEIVRGGTT